MMGITAMINVTSTSGADVWINSATIARVSPNLVGDADGATIVEYEDQALHTQEDPQALVTRISSDTPLIRLTRPDGSPVWVNKTMVNGIRAPVPSEIPTTGTANAFFLVGGHRQVVRESV